MHASNLPLTMWYWAAYLMATHSNGISGVQLQKQLGLGSYSTAWLLLGKLRSAMVDSDRNPLSGLVEIDETSIRHRTGNGAVGRGRSHKGKLMIVGAVETEICDKKATRDAFAYLRFQITQLKPWVALSRARLLAAVLSKPMGFRLTTIYPEQITINRSLETSWPITCFPDFTAFFSNLKAWEIGVYRGLRAKHLQSYLDEFIFRFHRRRNRHAGLRSLLNLAMKSKPHDIQDFDRA